MTVDLKHIHTGIKIPIFKINDNFSILDIDLHVVTMSYIDSSWFISFQYIIIYLSYIYEIQMYKA